MKKKLYIITAIGISVGILAFILKNHFDIGEQSFRKLYFTAGAVAIILTVLINSIYNIPFSLKLNKLAKLLTGEKNIKLFIAENQALLNKSKGKFRKAMIQINLSAGYCHRGDFKKAKKILIGIQENSLGGVNKIIYHNNLAYVHFRLEEYDEGVALLKKYNKEFLKKENHKALGGNIAVLRIFEFLAYEKIEEARALLSASQIRWTEENIKVDWSYLAEKITLIEGKD